MDESLLPQEPGIYMLMNMATRERYIGCAVNIARRVHRHFRELRNGKHTNKLLQEAFQQHGEASFEVRVLELCPDTRAMPEREHWHIIRRQPEYNETSTERAIHAATERSMARFAAYRAQNPPTHPPRPMSESEKAILQELHERAEQRRLEGIERMKNRIID
jgi:group I intron endonuclease